MSFYCLAPLLLTLFADCVFSAADCLSPCLQAKQTLPSWFLCVSCLITVEQSLMQHHGILFTCGKLHPQCGPQSFRQFSGLHLTMSAAQKKRKSNFRLWLERPAWKSLAVGRQALRSHCPGDGTHRKCLTLAGNCQGSFGKYLLVSIGAAGMWCCPAAAVVNYALC